MDTQPVINHLIVIDPALKILFEEVIKSNHNQPLDFTTLLKTPFVALVGAIIGQKIRFTEARQIRSFIYQNLTTLFDASRLYQFLIDLERQDQTSINNPISNNTIQLLKTTCQFVLEQRLDLNAESDFNRVSEISGIGPWTLNTAKLTTLKWEGCWDLFPIGDIFIRKRIQRIYNLDHSPSDSEVKTISEKWSPYRGFVAWYLWRLF